MSLELPLNVSGITNCESNAECFLISMYQYGTPRVGAVARVKFSDSSLQLEQYVESRPIFNISSWNCDTAAAACSDNTVQLFDSMELSHKTIKLPDNNISSNDAFCTFVSRLGDAAFTSTVSGNCALIDVESGAFTWEARCHEMETWTCGFLDDKLLVTGSDDGLSKIWDFRQNKCIHSVKHASGVTHVNHFEQTEFITGSYDDTLRLWDLRQLTHCESEVNLGGGVWRAEKNPVYPNILGVAAMFSGAHIVSVAKNRSFETLDSSGSNSDKTLTYGFSWFAEGKKCLIGSHYDKLVEVWEPLLPL